MSGINELQGGIARDFCDSPVRCGLFVGDPLAWVLRRPWNLSPPAAEAWYGEPNA